MVTQHYLQDGMSEPETWRDSSDQVHLTRPRTRGDCVGGPRPCPWVGCRHNLYLDVRRVGTVQLHFVEEPDEVVGNTLCSLDYAGKDSMTLQSIAELMMVTRERIRQLQDTALAKVKRSVELSGTLSVDDIPDAKVDVWDTDD